LDSGLRRNDEQKTLRIYLFDFLATDSSGAKAEIHPDWKWIPTFAGMAKKPVYGSTGNTGIDQF
jgi:hypothetical protein